VSAAEVTGESSAFYEWLLSDHPDARAERGCRREAYYRSEIERTGQVQAWVAKIDATPDPPPTIRGLAETMGPLADRSRARAEAALAEPDEAYVARERGNWETFMRVSAPDGWPEYRYPARYIGEASGGQPRPEAEPEPEAARDEPEIAS
jgi:hypothetical protein